MKPETVNVYKVFETTRRYVVPLFQREYVWKEEENWEPLWEDVEELVEGLMRNDADPHFLGAVVFQPITRTRTREIDSSEIIDGQQRLITLQLFLKALRDRSNATSDDWLKKELYRVTYNDFETDDKSMNYKIWPTRSDQTVYSSIMASTNAAEVKDFYKSQENNSSDFLPRLVQAYSYFDTQLAVFAKKNENVEESKLIEYFFTAIRDYLQVVTIDLNSETDDPQVIFETLNALGEPLLPSDLIRNFLLREAQQEEEGSLDQMYEKYWQQYDMRPAEDAQHESNRFWKKEEREGREFRPRLDWFFYHYLQYRANKDFKIGRLYHEFTKWWQKRENRTVEEGLAKIKSYSDVFTRFILPDTSTRIGLFLERLRIMDTTTPYPILMAVLGPDTNSMDEERKLKLVIDLESFLVRRMICRLTPKNYNRFFHSMLDEIHTSELTPDEVVRARLLRSQEDTARWPSDEDLEEKFAFQAVYGANRLRQDRIVMILKAIETQQYNGKQEKSTIDRAVSIEHVMPDAWREHWMLPPNAEENVAWEGMTADQYRDYMKHCLGNLTLVTQPLNSALQHSAFNVKKPALMENSLLKLNKYFEPIDDWNETEIVKRANHLCGFAKQIWPRPQIKKEN